MEEFYFTKKDWLTYTKSDVEEILEDLEGQSDACKSFITELRNLEKQFLFFDATSLISDVEELTERVDTIENSAKGTLKLFN